MVTQQRAHGLAESRVAETVVARPSERRTNRSVLMIDYLFPPIGGAGVRRTLGLVRHLADFGWSPTVLTVRQGDFHQYDFDLLGMIPATVEVRRTASLEPFRFARRILGRNVDPRNNLDRHGRSSGVPWNGPRLIRDVADLLLFPDRRIGWLPFAVAGALKSRRVQPFDAIYSTSTSVTSHLAALLLKKMLGLPWVADFQDPWVDTEFRSPGFRRTIAEHIERLILHTADRVTFASEPVRAALQRRYALPSDKLMTVLLGFDPDAFEGIEPVTRAKFTVTHFGSFCFGRSPVSFLRALAECLHERPGLRGEIEVLFFGSFESKPLGETEALLSQFGLTDVVHLGGLIPYHLGLRYLVGSDVLLLIAFPGDDGQNLVPTKLFDYLGAGRPMLALLPDGQAADVVRQARAGDVVGPDDVGAIKDLILRLHARWKQGALSLLADREMVKRCTIREIARQFSTILDDMVGAAGPNSHQTQAERPRVRPR
jgi:glycosyltransferase involved in cell wall biosynthesis